MLHTTIGVATCQASSLLVKSVWLLANGEAKAISRNANARKTKKVLMDRMLADTPRRGVLPVDGCSEQSFDKWNDLMA